MENQPPQYHTPQTSDKKKNNNNSSNNNNNNSKLSRRDPCAIIQPCFSGVSGAIFIVIFIFINIVVFLMEGPLIYLNIIYTLYVLIIAAFVFQILLDLGIWETTKTGKPGTRIFLSRLCPALCICLSVPPAALLCHTKNRGGFSTQTSDISLIFSILIVVLEILHLVVTILIYSGLGREGEQRDESVRFSYYSDSSSSAGPSPSSSIRSSRIDFITNRSRNSLASIDSGFLNNADSNYSFGNATSIRPIESVMDLSARFCEQQHTARRGSIYEYMEHHDIILLGSPPMDSSHAYNGNPPPSQTGWENCSIRSDASSIVFGSDSNKFAPRRNSSRSSDTAGFSERRFDDHRAAAGGGGRSTVNHHRLSLDDASMDIIHGIGSTGGSRSSNRSRRSRDYGGYRVEEEIDYQPGFFRPPYM